MAPGGEKAEMDVASEFTHVHGRIDRIETSLERMNTETLPRMAELIQSSSQEERTEAERRHERLMERFDKNRPNIISMLTLISGAVALGITVLGSYGKLALDHNTEDITRLETVQRGVLANKASNDDVIRVEKALEKTNEAIEKTNDTIDKVTTRTMPYNEVKFRTDSNEAGVKHLDDIKLGKDVFAEYSKRIDENQQNLWTALRRFVDKSADQFESINNRLVSRSENEYHWNNYDRQYARRPAQKFASANRPNEGSESGRKSASHAAPDIHVAIHPAAERSLTTHGRPVRAIRA